MRVGRALFRYALNEQSSLLGVASLGLKTLPTTMRQRVVLERVLKAAEKELDTPTELRETDEAFITTRTICPCVFRKRQKHWGVCDYVTVGGYQETLKWATGKMFSVKQTKCLNLGDEVDEFVIAKTALADE